jgi:hypothetical protein
MAIRTLVASAEETDKSAKVKNQAAAKRDFTDNVPFDFPADLFPVKEAHGVIAKNFALLRL